MNEKNERNDLTETKAQKADETGMTGEEAHRAGEFEELRGMLERVLSGIDSITERIGGLVDSANAVTIDNGAKIVDGEYASEGVAGDVVVLDEPENPRDRDYTI